MFFIIIIFSGILFSILASFLDVLSFRVIDAFYSSNRKKIANPWHYIFYYRSYCEFCKEHIPWLYLLPVIGYWLTKQKCHACHEVLDSRFFIFELIAFFYGCCIGYISIDHYSLIGLYSIYFLCVGFIIRLDWETMFVPRPSIYILFSIAIIEFSIQKTVYQHYSLGIAIIWYTTFYIIRVLYKQKLGGADVKIIFPIILSAGYPFSLMLPSLASSLGIGYYIYQVKSSQKDRGLKTKLPFASFLGITFLLTKMIQDIYYKIQ